MVNEASPEIASATVRLVYFASGLAPGRCTRYKPPRILTHLHKRLLTAPLHVACWGPSRWRLRPRLVPAQARRTGCDTSRGFRNAYRRRFCIGRGRLQRQRPCCLRYPTFPRALRSCPMRSRPRSRARLASPHCPRQPRDMGQCQGCMVSRALSAECSPNFLQKVCQRRIARAQSRLKQTTAQRA